MKLLILGIVLITSYVLATSLQIDTPKWDDDCVRGDIGCEFE